MPLTQCVQDGVAPRAGARIETNGCRGFRPARTSPPVRGRGLKQEEWLALDKQWKSPPVRGRGLKHVQPSEQPALQVAPRAGARIETFQAARAA